MRVGRVAGRIRPPARAIRLRNRLLRTQPQVGREHLVGLPCDGLADAIRQETDRGQRRDGEADGSQQHQHLARAQLAAEAAEREKSAFTRRPCVVADEPPASRAQDPVAAFGERAVVRDEHERRRRAAVQLEHQLHDRSRRCGCRGCRSARRRTARRARSQMRAQSRRAAFRRRTAAPGSGSSAPRPTFSMISRARLRASA